MTDAESPALDLLDRLAIELVAVTNAAITEGGLNDLSFSQWRLLAALGTAGRPLRLHEVAERVSASMPSASRLVQRMERRGFVQITRTPADGRGREISLTVEGEAIRARVISRRRAIIADAVGAVGHDPAAADVLARIVERLSGWA